MLPLTVTGKSNRRSLFLSAHPKTNSNLACTGPFWLLPGLLLLLGLPGCIQGGVEKPAQPLRIAAASDLTHCLGEIAAAFEEQHPDISVSLQFGASGGLFAQIEQSAPFDIFLSADANYPQRLAEKGLTRESRPFPYAVGHLVLWVPNSHSLAQKNSLREVLVDPQCRKIAIANPRHAPYGRAAKAHLETEGLWETVQSRLVWADNVAQAAQWLDASGADAGFLSLASIRSPRWRQPGKTWAIPTAPGEPLIQAGVILKTCAEPEKAELFKTFLLGRPGSEILGRHGFDLPGN